MTATSFFRNRSKSHICYTRLLLGCTITVIHDLIRHDLIFPGVLLKHWLSAIMRYFRALKLASLVYFTNLGLTSVFFLWWRQIVVRIVDITALTWVQVRHYAWLLMLSHWSLCIFLTLLLNRLLSAKEKCLHETSGSLSYSTTCSCLAH